MSANASIAGDNIMDIVASFSEEAMEALALSAQLDRTNTLIIGSDIDVINALRMCGISDHVIDVFTSEPLDDVLPPAGFEGTLVIHDVGFLFPDEEITLLNWIDRNPGARIISTSDQSLVGPVKENEGKPAWFTVNESLYYRLNAIVVKIGLN